jgi:hypothetical protein
MKAGAEDLVQHIIQDTFPLQLERLTTKKQVLQNPGKF